MSKNDTIWLRHMLDAAKEALYFAEGKTRNDLNESRMLVLSLVKSVEIIGEATLHITDATKNQSSDIQWKEIRGMRNRLVHAYFDIDLDVLWQTVEKDLPLLIQNIESVLDRPDK
ncbi:MAG: DUF86 domain-containing protein [Candidatus Dadabacteria bacterium]|nr:DUF86 domain-containing protein [Candidatus Dadabacteria bacterium]